MVNMKSEIYLGIEIVFHEIEGRVFAGFPKRPQVVSGQTKEEAFAEIKKIVDGFDPIIHKAYMQYPKAMRELEDM